jgi:hypothetical protein
MLIAVLGYEPHQRGQPSAYPRVMGIQPPRLFGIAGEEIVPREATCGWATTGRLSYRPGSLATSAWE